MEESEGATTFAESSTGASETVTSTTRGPADGSTSTSSEPVTTSLDTGEDGSVFLPLPDFICASGGELQAHCIFECEPLALDCREGEKCVAWANDGGEIWNATRCSPVAEEPAALGEPCTAVGSPASGIDDCDADGMCWGVDPQTLQGTCVPICHPDLPSTCAEDHVCAAYDDQQDFAPYVCLPRCDPLDRAACPPDQACRAIEDETLCVPLVSLPQGLSCGAVDQHCDGEACVWAEALASCDAPQCCRPWCDLSALDPDLPCAAVPGEVCRPYHEEPPAGLEHVGVCALPG